MGIVSIIKYVLLLKTFCVWTAKGAEYLDLTHEINENIPVYPGITPLRVTVLYNGTHPNGYWYQSEDITSCIHVGTHLDAPCHFAEGKWCINEIPFERFIAPAAVVDISYKMTNGSVSNLMPEDLEEWENVYGKIPNGSVLILKTGWGQFWNDTEKFVNGSEFKKTPGFSREAAEWLVNNTSIYGVGVETLSLDEMASKTYPAHVTLLSANIYAIEVLANVDKLPAKGATIYAMPVKIANASGGHARVFAKLPSE
ncbi:isatin hydrolase-like [Centruroides vittatus]|uniref:isatin hydrolase-like n=1 Tax=Centruroides vittatus TaxID=120091 RepID=UPI00350F6383